MVWAWLELLSFQPSTMHSRAAPAMSRPFDTPPLTLTLTHCSSEWPQSRWNPDGLLQRCVRALKKEVPELLVITDVALDPYSSDGHDGYVHHPPTQMPLSSFLRILPLLALPRSLMRA